MAAFAACRFGHDATMMRTALVALLVLTACGNDGDPAGVGPSPSTPSSHPPTAGAAADVGATLKNMATAEESYAVENQRYTKSVADLEAQGFEPGEVRASVVSASATRFCLKVSGGGLTLYYDSAIGVPGPKPCR